MKAFNTFCVICWALGLTTEGDRLQGLSGLSPYWKYIEPVAKTQAPLLA
jgi:hypothetical protein